MNLVAERYASALFELAREEGKDHRFKEETQFVAQTLKAHPELTHLLSRSQLSKDEKRRILDDIFKDRLDPYVLHVLKLMSDKHRQRLYGAMAQAYIRLYNQHYNILEAIVYSVKPLSEAEHQALQAELSAKEHKTVHLENRLDPTLLSGIKLSYGDKIVDGSMRARLLNLRTNLLKERS